MLTINVGVFSTQKIFYGEYAKWVTWAKIKDTQLSDPLHRAVNAERTVQLVCHRTELLHKNGGKGHLALVEVRTK